MNVNLATPWALALLPLAGLAAFWLDRRRRGDSRLLLPRAAIGLRLARSPWVVLDRALPWIRGLALGLLVVGLARPQSGESIEQLSSAGVDIVLALDISGSMRAEDFRPANRLEVARRTAAAFVAGRPSDRIGLVAFASLATTRCPLTLDHELLLGFLDELDFAPTDQQRTAIGMGLATAVNRLRRSEAKSRVIVLVTDGQNTAGEVGPKAAAEAAAALGVKVYTIGVGSDGEVPLPVDTPFGRRYEMVRMDLDEALLEEVASSTGGRYFRAVDAEGLSQIFQTIDGLEKTEITSQVRVLYSEQFHWFVLPALGLFLIERVLGATRLRRIP